MHSSSQGKGIQVQFTVTIPAIEPQELQFESNPKSGANRMLIGRGGFGAVYAGRYQGKPVAIKTLHVTTIKVVKSLYEEAAVMFRLASPYTVKLQGICSDENETSLVMERMMGGSLFHLLQDESQELPWALRYRLAYEIAEGLWSLHSQEILHRDLKSLNVLLDEKKHAKITDFGFSKLRGQVTSMAPSSKHSLGTLAYKSPELVAQDLADSDSDEEGTAEAAKKLAPYTPYSDVYAYGVILWEIATRQTPFAGQEPIKVYKKIAKGKHEKIPEDCPPEFAALIKKCWAMKPGQRPRTDEIVAQTKAWYQATQAEEKDDFAVSGAIDNANKKAVPSISIKDAETLKAAQQLAEQTQKEKEAIARRQEIEAEKEAAVKQAVEQSEKSVAFEKEKAEKVAKLAKSQADVQAEKMKQLEAKLAAMEAEAASAKAKAEQLAAEKAQVEADQKYAEKMQAEQAQKIAEQEKIQQQQAEQAQKEQEKAAQRNKAAAEEDKESGTEGRIKMYSPVPAKPPKAAGWFNFLRPKEPEQLQDNTPPHVAKFLRLVAEGEQDKAEAMLKADPSLALQSGQVTDLSKRLFHHITAFQYALWALDWNMWLMLLKYIPREEAQLQAMALDENGTEHGKHFDFSQLLKAYQVYKQHYNELNMEQRGAYWCQQVGGAQLLLPAHVINEYCRPDRAFYPLPNFNQEGLPRVREMDGKARSDVFTQRYNGGGCGKKWGLIRGNFMGACAYDVLRLGNYSIYSHQGNACVSAARYIDRAAVTALSETRLQQQQLLMKELLSNKPLVVQKK
jgi:serine/threonine protein kinase